MDKQYLLLLNGHFHFLAAIPIDQFLWPEHLVEVIRSTPSSQSLPVRFIKQTFFDAQYVCLGGMSYLIRR